jgi:threonyl-tRNA synthetase
LKRAHQCGTVQCDFQLPIRFNLQYKTDEGDAQKAQEGGKKEMMSQFFSKDEYDENDFTW